MKKLIALSIILLLFSLNADDFLTIPLFFENRIPADIAKIEEMASNLVKEKIGIGLRIIPITRFNIGDVDTRTILELEMMKKEGIIFDITNDLMPETEMIPLTTMLNEQGKEILRIVKENGAFFDIEENGIIRKLPSVSDIGMATGIAMRADILEKYSIDADKIKTIDDIDAVFKVVSENEPDMRMISGYQSKQFSPFSRFLSQKAVKGQFFVLDENDRLVNYYGSDEFEHLAKLARQWREAGYFPGNMELQNIPGSAMVRAGVLFSYTLAYKPSAEYESTLDSGYDMKVIQLTEATIAPRSTDLRYWGITQKSQHPEEAMKFLELLYTDADLVNLLLYGIEGEHYIVLEDNFIAYPEGVDSTTSRYENATLWQFPNQYLSYVKRENDIDIWERTKLFNKSADVSELIGFEFVPEDTQQYLDSVNAVISRYAYGLGMGFLNTDIYLPIMLSEMKEAGLDAVEEEINAQYRRWKSESLDYR